MGEVIKYIGLIIENDCERITLSNPLSKQELYIKTVIERKGEIYQISKYTDKQVFHENIKLNNLSQRINELVELSHYRQVNAISRDTEHILLISKKGVCNYKKKSCVAKDNFNSSDSHNKKKNYILREGEIIQPLIDMGIFSQDGKIINSMYSKYRQINRFLEIIDDEISKCGISKLNIIDFGCGKSYLTFILYYYLTEIMKIDANVIGLDLKADVIEKCNIAAQKYGYSTLRFEQGDINGYNAPFDVDMVISLHACDTATDHALYNAVSWNAKYIFSVPCCQHELNYQMKPESLNILSRYGIVKERFAALATDAIRANLLEYCGYKTQLLEFIDFEHTPKNILIRASKRATTNKTVKEKTLTEINALCNEFGFKPTLKSLIFGD